MPTSIFEKEAQKKAEADNKAAEAQFQAQANRKAAEIKAKAE